MKKIVSLFKRDYEGNRQIYNEIVEGGEWVVEGEGYATLKMDGTSCLVRDGRLYRRYEVKNKRSVPNGFEPAQNPDPITGDQPGWLPVSADDPGDKWHREAWTELLQVSTPVDGTYELIGPKIQNNPHNEDRHVLVKHGLYIVPNVPRDFDGLRSFLESNEIEGIVWHHPDGRMVKIKRRDFGFEWPVKRKKQEEYG
jgi:hypothetical protein